MKNSGQKYTAMMTSFFSYKKHDFSSQIAFIFKYVNEHSVVILNMVLKVVNGKYIKSYDEFKFENWKI